MKRGANVLAVLIAIGSAAVPHALAGQELDDPRTLRDRVEHRGHAWKERETIGPHFEHASRCQEIDIHQAAAPGLDRNRVPGRPRSFAFDLGAQLFHVIPGVGAVRQHLLTHILEHALCVVSPARDGAGAQKRDVFPDLGMLELVAFEAIE